MFFPERSTQAECFDHPDREAAEVAAEYRELDRLNQVFLPWLPFAMNIPKWLGASRCRQLQILDVGAGTGWLGRQLRLQAGKRGRDWQFTDLDASEVAQRMNGGGRAVVGSALKLPFPDASFDLVISSQMTHHLNDSDIVAHWREAWRVTRDAVFFCDLHRNAGLYFLLWSTTRLVTRNRHVREDALVSVRRGFRCPEWVELAMQANLPDAKVWLFFGTRIVLQARKRV